MCPGGLRPRPLPPDHRDPLAQRIECQVDLGEVVRPVWREPEMPVRSGDRDASIGEPPRAVREIEVSGRYRGEDARAEFGVGRSDGAEPLGCEPTLERVEDRLHVRVDHRRPESLERGGGCVQGREAGGARHADVEHLSGSS